MGSRRFTTLNTKLVMSFLALGVVPVLVLGWYSHQSSAQQLREASAKRLENAAITDGDIIDRNLSERYGDVQAFAANPLAQGSVSERQQIVDFLTVNYGIYEVMLIVDLDGRIMTANGVDGAGSAVQSDKLVGRDVSNSEWFKVVSSGKTPLGGTYYTDVHHSDLVARMYGHELLTLPFTAPIYDDSGDMVAIWHNEVSFERVVSDIMDQRKAAFAAQGLVAIETQILRTDGIVIDGADHDLILNLNLMEAGLEAALGATGPGGSSGFTIETNIRSEIEQINGYAVTDGALGFDGYRWGVLIRQATSEAAAPADALRRSLFPIGLLIAVVTAGAGFWLARSLTKPLERNVCKLENVAKGDLRVEFDVDRGDEVGQMATALNTALASIGATLAQVDHSAEDLTYSANNLTSLSSEISGAATATSDQANEVAATAEQIAAGSSSVARAMNQMTASVRDISDNTADAARMTTKAVEVSGRTRERMEKLESSATDIGNVVNVITSIAEQTDLLALNATIEAARVGEAGKGFAVVANEVKTLASQTSKATEEIQTRIEGIQGDAVDAVDAIAEIVDLIDKVNETSTAIAGAVEEQSATTVEVSSSIQAMTDGTINISENSSAVADAARTTMAGAARALDAADHLSVLADHLNSLLARFRLSDSQLLAAEAEDGRDYRLEVTVEQPELVKADVALPVRASSEKTLEDLASDLLDAGGDALATRM